jgi:type II secretory pathway component PulK
MVSRTRRSRPRRRGMAFMLALFVMAVTSMIVVTILDTQTMQYSALRNTIDYDRARYLAEAGIQHALSTLEIDFDLDETTGFTIPATEFPAGSGNQYQASVSALQADGTRLVTAQGTAGSFTRRLQIRVKMGG